MRRDLDLIRKIVLAVEDLPEGELFTGAEFHLDGGGYSEMQVNYHQYLICDAGWAEGDDISDINATTPQWIITHLTSAGHDFADAARNESAWKRARGKVASTGGTISLDILKDLLIAYAKGKLGLDP